jgi:hypothetical protein
MKACVSTYPLTIFILSCANEGLLQGKESAHKLNQNNGNTLVFRKLWTSMLRDIDLSWSTSLVPLFRPFVNISDDSGWYHMAGESASISRPPALSQIAVNAVEHCLSVREVDCCCFLWNETIPFCAYKTPCCFNNHQMFMLLLCLCYFTLLLLVFRDFLEIYRGFFAHGYRCLWFRCYWFFCRAQFITKFDKPLCLLCGTLMNICYCWPFFCFSLPWRRKIISYCNKNQSKIKSVKRDCFCTMQIQLLSPRNKKDTWMGKTVSFFCPFHIVSPFSHSNILLFHPSIKKIVTIYVLISSM